jgi:hypothetical protein
MTDLTPNDLSHLSDAEFQSLCPQGYHAPGAEPLSPAAQAVKDAVLALYSDETVHKFGWQLDAPTVAAALCSIADEVVPEEPLYGGDQRWEWERDARQSSRKKILAIATELEGHG